MENILGTNSTSLCEQVRQSLRDRVFQIIGDYTANAGSPLDTDISVTARLEEINLIANKLIGKQFPCEAYLLIFHYANFAKKLAEQERLTPIGYTLYEAMEDNNWNAGVKDFVRSAVQNRILSARYYQPSNLAEFLSEEKIKSLFEEIKNTENNDDQLNNLDSYIYNYLFPCINPEAISRAAFSCE